MFLQASCIAVTNSDCRRWEFAKTILAILIDRKMKLEQAELILPSLALGGSQDSTTL